jgi:hypothetical protein
MSPHLYTAVNLSLAPSLSLYQTVQLSIFFPSESAELMRNRGSTSILLNLDLRGVPG